MLKSGVDSTWEDVMAERKLLDAPQSLKCGSVDYLHFFRCQTDESMNRVPNYLGKLHLRADDEAESQGYKHYRGKDGSVFNAEEGGCVKERRSVREGAKLSGQTVLARPGTDIPQKSVVPWVGFRPL